MNTALHGYGPYKLVRMSMHADLDAAYPYICACIEDTSVADKLETLVIGNGHWRKLIRHRHHPEPEPYVPRDGTHEALLSHVRGLGLSADLTRCMVDALEWKKQGKFIDVGYASDWSPEGRAAIARVEGFACTACVVMLSLCRNIATVHVDTFTPGYADDPPEASEHDILARYLISRNYGVVENPDQGMQKLRSIVVNPVDNRDSSHAHQADEYHDTPVMDIMRSFHRLTAIQSFTFMGVQVEQSTTRRTLPPRTSSYTKLCLEHVDLNGLEIGTLIRVSRNLEELRLSLGGLIQTMGSCINVSLKTLGKCLLEHKATLRVLDLDIAEASRFGGPETEHQTSDDADDSEEEREYEELCHDRWHRLDEADSSGPMLIDDLPTTRHYGYGMGSLHDFTALTHLSVQPAQLVSRPVDPYHQKRLEESGQTSFSSFEARRLVDMLPPSLEFLCLYGYKQGKQTWLDEQVDELMTQKGEKLPNLREMKGYEVELDGDGEEVREEEKKDQVVDERKKRQRVEKKTWRRPHPDLSWQAA